MSNLFKNKAKLMYFAFGILIFVVLLASLAYMTNYAHIHIYYMKDSTTGVLQINPTTEFPKTEASNQQLFNYFANYHSEINMEEFKWTIFNFQVDMSSLNTFFITFAVVGLICFAALLICANHSRRVYYKSNLICGIIAPLVTCVLAVVALVRNLLLMGTFNTNYELFNEVAMIQNPANQAKVITGGKDFVTSAQPCNSTTYILFAILFAVVAIYSIVLIIYAIKKYKDNTELRNEIIRRAVENDGQ